MTMTKHYAILIRGINVGGKNSVSMSKLKICLEELGFQEVKTYIASGNVIVKSDKNPNQIQALLEKTIPKHFKISNDLIKVLVLTKNELKSVVAKKPKGFGETPTKYHSDVIFLMGISTTQAMKVFDPKEGVDMIWKGQGVVYSQRLSALRTKSRLNKIMGTPEYKSMTIRNWNTVTKLVGMFELRG